MATQKTPEDTPGTVETEGPDSGSAGTVRSALRDPTAAIERVVQGAHETIDKVAASTIPAVEHWTQKAAHAGEVLNERADHLGELQEQFLEDARHTVREHPIASVLAAVAVGMIVARLTSR